VIGGSPPDGNLPIRRLAAAPGVPAAAGPGDRVLVSAGGLVMPRQLPFERWLGIGRQLSAVSTSAAWCLGDWLRFGENAYAGRYRQAIEHTSLDYQTLRNYAWVAGRFTMSRRQDTLSFGHHAEVAALPEAEQDYWLRKAKEHRWPVKQLRHHVRDSLAQRTASRDDQPATAQCHEDRVNLRLHIRISPAQLETCQAAADEANLSIEAWTVLALEHAARHQLSRTETPQPPDDQAAPDISPRPRSPQQPVSFQPELSTAHRRYFDARTE
jgi:hypothetical protein